ncbi:unnamed protein product, partial [Vitis vinifera]|uniref:Uncharacterized protein n=1 Tax=Vitis vinifera TaxID=29760 RepID=D7TE81_VITVI
MLNLVSGASVWMLQVPSTLSLVMHREGSRSLRNKIEKSPKGCCFFEWFKSPLGHRCKSHEHPAPGPTSQPFHHLTCLQLSPLTRA